MELTPMLRVFDVHGVVFTEDKDGQLSGDCIFCEKEQHFFVNKESGLWDCKRCGRSGNIVTFMSQIIDHWKDNASQKEWDKLSKDRGIPVSALKSMGLVRTDRGFWLCPIRTYKGTMQDIRYWRYGGKMMTTKGRSLGLYGHEQLADVNRKKEPVYICEGEFDGGAMRHMLSMAKAPGIVVAVPGASIFKEAWVESFMHREVVLCYDNDGPGDDGSLKAGKMLAPIATVRYLCWMDTLPDGYDVRDFVKDAVAEKRVKKAWKDFKSLIKKEHRRITSAADSLTAPEEDLGPVPTFDELLAVYKKWLKMTPEMIDALKVSLAVIMSNQIAGDPVWLFIVGPPGSGKTALLTSTSESSQCVFKSSITPHAMISGWMGKEDPSLVPQLDNKTLVLKDYTEILQMNPVAKDEMLSILRGAYDGTASRTFGNGVVRQYISHFSVLAGVTAAINGNSKATLGERFLKYQAIKGTGFDADEQVRAAIMNVGSEVKMDLELKDIAKRFLSQRVDLQKCCSPNCEFVPDWVYERIIALAQLISILRAQVERNPYKDDIIYRPQHEMGTRLGKQLVKLGIAIAVVLGKDAVDDEVYKLMERVAFDTAVGFHLDLVQAVMYCKENGMETSSENLCRVAGLPSTSLGHKIDDLMMLKVLEKDRGVNKLGRAVKLSYRLTEEVIALYKRACVGENHIRRAIMARRKKNEKLIFVKRGKVNV